jgi:hypothetical protein
MFFSIFITVPIFCIQSHHFIEASYVLLQLVSAFIYLIDIAYNRYTVSLTIRISVYYIFRCETLSNILLDFNNIDF